MGRISSRLPSLSSTSLTHTDDRTHRAPPRCARRRLPRGALPVPRPEADGRRREVAPRAAGEDSGYAPLVSGEWPVLSYERWSETCDTLHAHTQVLGKLAVALAPPEPELQHAALRLTARGWETAPLPAPDGSGAVVVALDLRAHEAVAEHTDGGARRVALTPDRAV